MTLGTAIAYGVLIASAWVGLSVVIFALLHVHGRSGVQAE